MEGRKVTLTGGWGGGRFIKPPQGKKEALHKTPRPNRALHYGQLWTPPRHFVTTPGEKGTLYPPPPEQTRGFWESLAPERLFTLTLRTAAGQLLGDRSGPARLGPARPGSSVPVVVDVALSSAQSGLPDHFFLLPAGRQSGTVRLLPLHHQTLTGSWVPVRTVGPEESPNEKARTRTGRRQTQRQTGETDVTGVTFAALPITDSVPVQVYRVGPERQSPGSDCAVSGGVPG